MNDVVRWLRIVALLLAVLIVLIGLVGVQLFMRPAYAQSTNPVPVYVVNGPLGLFTWAKVGANGALRVETP